MVFSNFQMLEDDVNANDLQHNGTRYDQSALQASNAGGPTPFGPGNNSMWPSKNTLSGHQSTYSGSQMNSGMLGSFAQQQTFSHQPSIVDDNANLFATIQNQHQLLQPSSFQSMMGGASLQQFANSSSLGGGMGMGTGGIFNSMNSGANSNFAAMSIANDANILNGGQLENDFLPNNNHTFLLQQQLQLEQQQQLLLQQQQLQQHLQQNQMQLQQFQRQPLNFAELQPQLQSPFISTANSPLSRSLQALGKLGDTITLPYGDDVSDKGRTRTSRRPTSTALKASKMKSFPEKLMQALLENRDEDAVGWLPDGKSFVIVSPDKFMHQVLNKVFKSTKYSSFIRKLHRYSFVRLTSGTGTDCFYHPLFQKNRKDLASKIKSTSHDPTKKGQSHFKLSSIKPPSLAGVDKFVRARVLLKSVASGAPPDSELASIRSDVSEFQAAALDNDAETELIEL